VQHDFAALDVKCFLLSNIAQYLRTLTDMHSPTPACMLDALQLLVLDLANFANSLFYSLSIALQPHTTLCEYSFLRIIVYRFKPVVPKLF